MEVLKEHAPGIVVIEPGRQKQGSKVIASFKPVIYKTSRKDMVKEGKGEVGRKKRHREVEEKRGGRREAGKGILKFKSTVMKDFTRRFQRQT